MSDDVNNVWSRGRKDDRSNNKISRNDRSRSTKRSISDTPSQPEIMETIFGNTTKPPTFNDSNSQPTSQITEASAGQSSFDINLNYAPNIVQLKYDETHRGPYVVYVDTIPKEKTDDRIPINKYRLTNVLLDLKTPGILDIVKIGFARCKVIINNSTNANKLIEEKALEGRGYTVKVFEHLFTKTGIIFNIPEEITMPNLYKILSSPIPIARLIRVTRNDGTKQRVPTMKVKVIFKGLQIPKEMKFAYTKVTTKPFIPFGQCYNCFRFNHRATECKQKVPNCKTCFERHDAETICDNKNIKCPNCHEPHLPMDRNCPAREKALNLKRLMVLENLSLREARIRYASAMGSNRFDILGEDGLENNFPRLSQTNKNQTINNTSEAAKYIHKNVSYAKIVKVNNNRKREEEKARNNMQEWEEAIHEYNMEPTYNRSIENPHKTNEYERLIQKLNSTVKSLANLEKENTSSGEKKIIQLLKNLLDEATIEKDIQDIRMSLQK